MEGILNYSGHISVRLGEEAFLIHPLMDRRATIAATDILALDLDLQFLPDSAIGEFPLETYIHSEIYRARPDVKAVVHTHSELGAAFTLAEAKLLPLKSHAARWASGIPTHPDPSHINTVAQGRDLAGTLGQHQAALLRAHGGVIVAESVEAAMIDCVHFEENAKAQVQALAIGPLLPLTKDELALLTATSNRAQHVRKLWRYYVGLGVSRGLLESGDGLLDG